MWQGMVDNPLDLLVGMVAQLGRCEKTERVAWWNLSTAVP
jgi:hypothetical protein